MLASKTMQLGEEVAQAVLSLTEDQQNKFYETLRKTLTEDGVKVIQMYISAFRLMTDERYYKAVEKAVCEQIYKEATVR